MATLYLYRFRISYWFRRSREWSRRFDTELGPRVLPGRTRTWAGPRKPCKWATGDGQWSGRDEPLWKYRRSMTVRGSRPKPTQPFG